VEHAPAPIEAPNASRSEDRAGPAAWPPVESLYDRLTAVGITRTNCTLLPPLHWSANALSREAAFTGATLCVGEVLGGVIFMRCLNRSHTPPVYRKSSSMSIEDSRAIATSAFVCLLRARVPYG